MSFLHSQELVLYRDVVARWVERVVRPSLLALELDKALNAEELDRLFDAISSDGVLDDLPRDEGDCVDWTAFCILLEEISRASAGLAHLVVFRLASREFFAPLFDDAQKEAFAPYLERSLGVAGGLSEAGAGSNPGEIRTTATKCEGGWIINGTKLWISSASHAKAILTHCRTRNGDNEGYSLFFVERQQGWIARDIPMMGLNIHPVCEVVYDNVFVPDVAQLLGRDHALRELQRILRLARCFSAAMAVGIGQASLEAAISYATTREQFGRKIAGFQLVQGLLAEMATIVDAGRLLAYRAIDGLRGSEPNALIECSMAKYFCTEMSVKVASQAIQVHGAMGLARETGVERILRDARMMTIPDGTSEIHKLIIGRGLTGISALHG